MSSPAEWTANSLNDLTGLVALVTGSGTGIGLHIAKALSANGAKVYMAARRLNVLEDAIAANKEFPNLHPIQLDVTDKESIRKAVEQVEKADGKLDILVNNAAITGPINPATDATPVQTVGSFHALGPKALDGFNFDEWTQVYNANVVGPTALTFAFLQLLEKGANSSPRKDSGKGATSSVINVGSTMSQIHLGMGGVWAYKSSKAAFDHLTKSWAVDFAIKNIPVRVNCLAPGIFASQLNGDDQSVEERTEAGEPFYLHSYPLRRGGKGTEAGATAVYLASNASGYTNGSWLYVDGGIGIVNP